MKFIPIVVLLVLVTLVIGIMPNIFGGFETQHNMTASNYTDEYDAVTNITIADLKVIAGIGVLLVIGMVFVLAKILLR